MSSNYNMCPHTTTCMCPHTTTCMCPHTTIGMCPHTTIYVPYTTMCPHTTLCPHTPICVSSYPHICVLILLYMPSLYSACEQGPSSSGGSSPQPHSRILQLNRVEQDFGEVLDVLAFCWHKSTNTGTEVQILTQKALLAAGLD